MSKRRAIISASTMCANALALGADLRALEEARIDYLHIDVMDGHFVPNLGMGIDLVKQIKAATTIPLDVHLMVANPEFVVPKVLDEISPAILVFHLEATPHALYLTQKIRDRGVMAGIAINPATPVSALECVLPEVDLVLVMTVDPGFAGQRLIPSTLGKISEVRRRLDERGIDIPIAVDGNVSFEHGPSMWAAGADFFICGTSSLFHPQMGIVAAAQEFRKRMGDL